MKNIRLGVVGGGHLGRIHARLASGNQQFDVVAVVDSSAEVRQRIESELGLPTCSDYRDLCGHVDAAVVATPTVSHYEITSALLRAGIHCLVEKPLAHQYDQAERLVQIARNRNRVLQVGHVERFNPMWTTAQSQLGTPRYVEANRSGPFSGRSTDIGVVLDLMVHDLDLILSIEASQLVSVSASGLALLGEHEDMAEARLEFASGCVAVLRASRIARTATRRMQWYTTDGFVDIDFSGQAVRVVRPGEAILRRELDVNQMTPEARMRLKDRLYEDHMTTLSLPVEGRNAILDEQNDFALSIASQAQPACPGESGARAVEVANRIQQAIRDRGWDARTSRPRHVPPRPATVPFPAAKRGRRKAG